MEIEIGFLYLFLQLGLTENNICSYDFDMVASDPSDANTNSTTLFSDDTDDRSKRSTNPEPVISIQQEQEVNVRKTVLIK
jgi:pseudo-response regulator 1